MKKTITSAIIISLLAAIGCQKQEEAIAPRVSIHLAALQGRIDVIQQHIKAGSNLDEKDDYGSTPLIIAVSFDKTEVAKALIDAGADLTITNNDGSTPLHIAAFLCRTEIVQALLDKGADKNALNSFGNTALDSVSGPFEEVKEIYDAIAKGLKPFGLILDYERIKAARPKIAEMLR